MGASIREKRRVSNGGKGGNGGVGVKRSKSIAQAAAGNNGGKYTWETPRE